MKKTLAIVLALVMILSLATAASAASITITPPTVPEGATETGITYEAYKIFDATITYKTETVDGETVTTIDKVSYTIDSTSPYYETISAASTYFKLTQVGDSTTYVVEKLDAYDETVADSFAETLKAVSAATAAGTLTKQDDGSYKLDNLDPGYYLVTSTVGTDLILDTIGDISVDTKNTYPTLEKKVEGAESTTANMGEVLTFTINVTIPEDATGVIVVHDSMTGLEYQSMTEVSGIAVANGADDCCTKEFTLSADYVAANKNTTITITYTAKVTADVANNEAWLVDDTYTSTPDDTDVYSTDIVISKVDGSNNNAPLEGAEFVLYKEVTENETTTKLYYKLNEDGTVSWVTDSNEATVIKPVLNTANTAATAKVENIEDGTYYLLETKAPDGYNKLSAPQSVEVNAETATKTEGEGDDAVTITYVKDVEVTVTNNSGSELPSTGGIGTTLFYIFGAVLVVGAAVLLITKKRMSAEA